MLTWLLNSQTNSVLWNLNSAGIKGIHTIYIYIRKNKELQEREKRGSCECFNCYFCKKIKNKMNSVEDFMCKYWTL